MEKTETESQHEDSAAGDTGSSSSVDSKASVQAKPQKLTKNEEQYSKCYEDAMKNEKEDETIKKAFEQRLLQQQKHSEKNPGQKVMLTPDALGLREGFNTHARQMSQILQKLSIRNSNVLDLPVDTSIVYHTYDAVDLNGETKEKAGEKQEQQQALLENIKTWGSTYKWLLSNPIRGLDIFLLTCFPENAKKSLTELSQEDQRIATTVQFEPLSGLQRRIFINTYFIEFLKDNPNIKHVPQHIILRFLNGVPTGKLLEYLENIDSCVNSIFLRNKEDMEEAIRYDQMKATQRLIVQNANNPQSQYHKMNPQAIEDSQKWKRFNVDVDSGLLYDLKTMPIAFMKPDDRAKLMWNIDKNLNDIFQCYVEFCHQWKQVIGKLIVAPILAGDEYIEDVKASLQYIIEQFKTQNQTRKQQVEIFSDPQRFHNVIVAGYKAKKEAPMDAAKTRIDEIKRVFDGNSANNEEGKLLEKELGEVEKQYSALCDQYQKILEACEIPTPPPQMYEFQVNTAQNKKVGTFKIKPNNHKTSFDVEDEKNMKKAHHLVRLARPVFVKKVNLSEVQKVRNLLKRKQNNVNKPAVKKSKKTIDVIAVDNAGTKPSTHYTPFYEELPPERVKQLTGDKMIERVAQQAVDAIKSKKKQRRKVILSPTQPAALQVEIIQAQVIVDIVEEEKKIKNRFVKLPNRVPRADRKKAKNSNNNAKVTKKTKNLENETQSPTENTAGLDVQITQEDIKQDYIIQDSAGNVEVQTSILRQVEETFRQNIEEQQKLSEKTSENSTTTTNFYLEIPKPTGDEIQDNLRMEFYNLKYQNWLLYSLQEMKKTLESKDPEELDELDQEIQMVLEIQGKESEWITIQPKNIDEDEDEDEEEENKDENIDKDKNDEDEIKGGSFRFHDDDWNELVKKDRLTLREDASI